MDITEVRISLRPDGGSRKLKAYATVTFDSCFVVRDMRIIEGKKGLFVAMPSRKVRVACTSCGHRNPTRSRYCNECGSDISSVATPVPEEGSEPEHRDVAHPIKQEMRSYLEREVLSAYDNEMKAVKV